MRVMLSLMLIVNLSLWAFASEVKNIDKPLKGRWDFKMKKSWTADEAGEYVFAVIDAVKAANDGTVYVMDKKHYKIFVFNQDGKYLSSWGSKGEGPGEFSTLRNIFLINDNVLVVDDRNIHYFSRDGKYRKSVPNNFIAATPNDFVNLDKFISVSLYSGSDNIDDKGTICVNDITNKVIKEIVEFEKYKMNTIRVKINDNTSVYSFSISSLTPEMVMYYKNNRLYFGMSDKYMIKIIDLEGKEKFRFSLLRKRKKVSSEYKKEAIMRLDFPPHVKKLAKNNLPDYLNYFEEIYVDNNGLIYIFEPVNENMNLKKVDIFSQEGEYLYASEIKIDPDNMINGFHISGSTMYIVAENRSGEVKIVKYEIMMPK